MGRGTCSFTLNKGAWTEEEDRLLKKCIEIHGEGNWHKVPLRAGLNRCRKSCRLRWFNYLHPNIKRGEFAWDEIDLIIRMHKLLGNRWSLIAARLPGRTANDIKNRWNTHIHKSLQKKPSVLMKQISTTETITTHQKIKVLKPQPRTLSKKSQWMMKNTYSNSIEKTTTQCREVQNDEQISTKWWENLLFDVEEDDKETSSGSKDEFAIIDDSFSHDDMCLDMNLWET
ncbi:hypothetical protein AQUCO_01500090v1 [Aquilegia coerulea]|uniref:Uncharacterized protein n=1 Tax=Aquilegia coerulea TaxID=218851 RepID=A0A2G5DSV2_AQUCA|nr:hypothetical protein AQUCO_01500090v1 [Aquilegia coerulea]